jgi:Translation initiation factor IF-2, N-terminal region
MQSGTIRLFELANQLHTGAEELITLAHNLGLSVKSKMSKLSPEQITALREARENGLHALQQASLGSFSVAGLAPDSAATAEAADQAKDQAWAAKIEKIKAELQAASQHPEGSQNGPG